MSEILNLDHCAYYKRFEDNNIIILLLDVDDMLVAGPNKDWVQELKAQLAKEFDMKELRPVNMVLGMQIHQDRNNKKIWVSHKNYMEKKSYGTSTCKIVNQSLPHLLISSYF